MRLALAAVAAICASPVESVAATQKSTAFCSKANITAYLEQEGSTTVDGKNVKKLVDTKAFYERLRVETDKHKVMQTYWQSAYSDQRFPGTDAILQVWNEKYHLNDPRLLAYVLASAWHETATRMAPVRETLASTDAQAIQRLERHYVKNGRRGHYYWGVVKETGKAYFGRGHIQLTWADNYKKADTRLGIQDRANSFYWQPEFALDPRKSALITFDGMMYGWYRAGRCLPLYIKENRNADYRGARDIVNGDVSKNGTRIAKYAEAFAAALTYDGVVVTEEALEQKIEDRAKEEEEKVVEEKKEEQEKVEEVAKEVAEERKDDPDKTRMGKIETDLIALGRRINDLEVTIGKTTDAITQTTDAINREGEGRIQSIRESIAEVEKNAVERAEVQEMKVAELEEDVLGLRVTLDATHEAVVAIRGSLENRDQELAMLREQLDLQRTQLDLQRKQMDLQREQIVKIEKCTGLWNSIFGCDTGE